MAAVWTTAACDAQLSGASAPWGGCFLYTALVGSPVGRATSAATRGQRPRPGGLRPPTLVLDDVMTTSTRDLPGLNPAENLDWLNSLDAIIHRHGLTAPGRLLQELSRRGKHAGMQLLFTAKTPYLNTISPEEDRAYPSERDLEDRAKKLTLWKVNDSRRRVRKRRTPGEA